MTSLSINQCILLVVPSPRKHPLPPIATSVGSRLAAIRKSNGLTQTQVAERIGIQQYLVSSYETGRLHLSDEMLIRFAMALETSADAILGLDDAVIEGPSLKLVKRIKKIEQLPPAKQKALLQTIDGFLKGAGF